MRQSLAWLFATGCTTFVLFGSFFGFANPPTKTPNIIEKPTSNTLPPPDADLQTIKELERLEKTFHNRLSIKDIPSTLPDLSPYEGKTPENTHRLRKPAFSSTLSSNNSVVKEKKPLQIPKTQNIPSITPITFPYTNDPLVEAYIDFFTNEGRRYMENAIRRQGKYAKMMERIFQEEGVPVDLFGVAIVESGFKPKAYSYAHASGIWQFVPSTGRNYGLRSNSWYDERRHPEKSTRAAAKLLRDLQQKFGSWELALAAYNGGVGTVLKNVRQYNTNNFFTIGRLGGWPTQTRFYVPKVLAASLVFKNRDILGFSHIEPEATWQYELAHVPAGQISTKTLAKAAKISEETLLLYNPELLKGYTPPNYPELMIRLPINTGATFAKNLKTLWPKNQISFGRHIVRQGERIEDIAKYYEVSSKSLASLNRIEKNTALVGGSSILVPLSIKKSPHTSNSYDKTGRFRESFPGTYQYPDRKPAYYLVRYKDTLENLAKAFEVGTEEIVLWNGLDKNSNLISGTVLRLYLHKNFDLSRALLIDPGKIRAITRKKDGELSVQTIPERSKKRKRRRRKRRRRR